MDNNDAKNRKASELQKAFREALREAAAEVRQMRTAAKSIGNALKFLQKKSGGAFTFREMPTGNGDIVLETNLLTTTDRTAHALRVRINRQGEMFTNLPDDAAKAPPLPEDEDGLADQMEDYEAANQRMIEEEGYEARMDAMTEPPETVDTAEISTRTEEAALLREIGERAIFANQIISPDLEAATTPAQKALLEGARQAEIEIKVAEKAANGLIEGFELLRDMSQGYIKFDYWVEEGTSNIILEIGSAVGNYKFPYFYYNVSALGGIKMGPMADAYNEEFQYDVFTDVDQMLTTRTEAAVSAGLVSSASSQPAGTATAAQKMVLDTIRRTERAKEEIARARRTANDLIEELKKSAGDLLTFKVGEFRESREAVITVNTGGTLLRHLTIDSNGMMKVGNDAGRHFVFDEAAVAKALKPLIKEALFRKQATAPRQQPKSTPRPAI